MLAYVFLPVLVLAGGYFPWVSACAAMGLGGWLVVTGWQKKQVRIQMDGLFLSTICLAVGFLFSLVHPVDRSLACLGLVKFLPVPLFYILLCNTQKTQKERLLASLPAVGSGMTLLSLVLMQVPVIRPYVSVNGRLAGFFEYPNTFAVFLLVCLILAAGEGRKNTRSILFSALCLAGLLLSGSRTVYLMAAALGLGKLARMARETFRKRELHRKPGTGEENTVRKEEENTVRKREEKQTDWREQKWRKAVLWMVPAAGIVVALLLGGGVFIRRIGAVSLHSSTFLGRLLYARDALGMIARFPLGMGYYGYRFAQGYFQTGLYRVLNVHNEWLQLFLDLGWIPALAVIAFGIWGLFRQFKRRGILSEGNTSRFLAICVLLVHALFDYDFQFLGLCFLFLLLVDTDGGKEYTVPVFSRFCLLTGMLGMTLLCVRVGAADFFYVTGNAVRSEAAMPNTLAEISLLENMQEEMEGRSEADETQTEESGGDRTEERGEGYTEESRTDYTEENGGPSSMAEQQRLAQRILDRNAYAAPAYAAQALSCFASGEIEKMAVYQKAAIRTDPYRYGYYTNYLEMLYRAAVEYRNVKDEASAGKCVSLAGEIPGMLGALEKRTSTLGWQITDRPRTQLEEGYVRMLEELLQGKF